MAVKKKTAKKPAREARRREDTSFAYLAEIMDFVNKVPVEGPWLKKKQAAKVAGKKMYRAFLKAETGLRTVLNLYCEYRPCAGGVLRKPPLL